MLYDAFNSKLPNYFILKELNSKNILKKIIFFPVYLSLCPWGKKLMEMGKYSKKIVVVHIMTPITSFLCNMRNTIGFDDMQRENALFFLEYLPMSLKKTRKK